MLKGAGEGKDALKQSMWLKNVQLSAYGPLPMAPTSRSAAVTSRSWFRRPLLTRHTVIISRYGLLFSLGALAHGQFSASRGGGGDDGGGGGAAAGAEGEVAAGAPGLFDGVTLAVVGVITLQARRRRVRPGRRRAFGACVYVVRARRRFVVCGAVAVDASEGGAQRVAHARCVRLCAVGNVYCIWMVLLGGAGGRRADLGRCTQVRGQHPQELRDVDLDGRMRGALGPLTRPASARALGARATVTKHQIYKYFISIYCTYYIYIFY